LSEQVTRAQVQVRALEARDALLNQDGERAQVLRDLAPIAGTRFPGESLVEWSLWRQGISRRRLYWRDGRDPALTVSASAEPCGTLEVRRHALRIATLLVSQMEGQRLFVRQGDLSIWSLLTVVSARTEGPVKAFCIEIDEVGVIHTGIGRYRELATKTSHVRADFRGIDTGVSRAGRQCQLLRNEIEVD